MSKANKKTIKLNFHYSNSNKAVRGKIMVFEISPFLLLILFVTKFTFDRAVLHENVAFSIIVL